MGRTATIRVAASWMTPGTAPLTTRPPLATVPFKPEPQHAPNIALQPNQARGEALVPKRGRRGLTCQPPPVADEAGMHRWTYAFVRAVINQGLPFE